MSRPEICEKRFGILGALRPLCLWRREFPSAKKGLFLPNFSGHSGGEVSAFWGHIILYVPVLRRSSSRQPPVYGNVEIPKAAPAYGRGKNSISHSRARGARLRPGPRPVGPVLSDPLHVRADR